MNCSIESPESSQLCTIPQPRGLSSDIAKPCPLSEVTQTVAMLSSQLNPALNNHAPNAATLGPSIAGPQPGPPASLPVAPPAASEFRLPPTGVKLEELEKSLLLQALEQARHNQTRAAQLLGITRHTLRYRMEKHGMLAAHNAPVS